MSSRFDYRDGLLHCEDVPLDRVADQFGTPAYVYSSATILDRFESYRRPLHDVPALVCYAVKANANLALLQLLARAGAGFDIVSGGELYRVLAAGADPRCIVFSGVGKTAPEIENALGAGIHSFNCESEQELALISSLAVRLGRTATVALRVNPDVDASTHPYISTGLMQHKFGIPIDEAEAVYRRAAALPQLRVTGVSCHIGSQLLQVEPLIEAADRVIALVRRLREQQIPIQTLDMGGGLGIPYHANDEPVSPACWVERLKRKVAGLGLTLILEPGRSIVGEAGILLTRVLFTKQNRGKHFIIVDAAMNDLLRPSLYQAFHNVVPVRLDGNGAPMVADIVGPVCETGDYLAQGRTLPAVGPGELLAVRSAGAYGFSLASNYNGRPRACELLVSGAAIHVARERERYTDLIRGEHLQPESTPLRRS